MALSLLLWKNFKLKQRQWGKTLAEILAPLIFFLILVAVRKSQDFMVKSPDCQFKPSSLTSNGIEAALTSFCFLGVCQSEDTGYAKKSIFNSSELVQINEAVTLYNKLYSNPVLSKYRMVLDVTPTNWSDPAGSTALNFTSFFNNPGALFDNVTATAAQQDLVLGTTLMVPSRLSVDTETGVLPLLSATMAPLSGQLICNFSTGISNDTSSGGSEGWVTISTLCNQAQFRTNLQNQFNISLLLNQVNSAASDSYTLPMNVTDLPVLTAFVSNVSSLLQTNTAFSQLSQLLGGMSSDVKTTIGSISKLLCGAGETTVTSVYSRLSSKAQEFLQNTSLVFSAANPVFATLLPPTMYCYNQTVLKAIMAEVSMLLSPLGMSQLPNLLFGEVLYYPRNDATNKNLEMLNTTFERLGLISDLAKAWITTEKARMADFIANGTQAEELRRFFTICNRITGGGTGSLCKMGSDFLSQTATTASGISNWESTMVTIDAIMRRIYFYTACFKLKKLRSFETETAMNDYAFYLIDEFKQNENASKPYFMAAVAFDTLGGATFEKYRLRMASDKVDSTIRFRVIDRSWSPKPRSTFPDNFKYFTSFFLHLQELLEQGIVSRILGGNTAQIIYLRLFPSPCFIQDQFTTVIQSVIPMIMTLAWIYSVTLLVNAVVYEKESRLKEMMKIMGLADWEHWLAWFMTSGCIMLVATILMTILIKAGGIIVNSHPLILFFFILSFVVSTICEAFFISVFFSNSSVASAFAGVLFFVGYIPYTVVERFIESMGNGALAVSCLIPQVGFGLGCKYIGLWELANVGIQPSNVAKSPLMDSSFSFGGVLLMLWIDALLLMLLTWYIEKVFPGKYGVPKPFYFPFTKSYWCSSCSKLEVAPDQGDVEMTGDRQHFEEEPRNLKVGAALRALTKVYKPGLCACKNAKEFIAVNSVTYNFYEGQVTSFLGHNGAGKSTTVSILTGLFTPTTGTAYIYGHDIRTQMDQIRSNLGFCPQHNVLFNHLTVQDHIYFYGMLKGLDKKTIGSQIDNFVTDVGLANKRFELSKNLSGGMKRKLSVAMAFVGDSKLIILDEPTAGVDPHARRSIWDVLGKFRSGRTILLTTHHMDEADNLGDRICIIDKGRLVCSGSPMFLKKTFGHGYTLTLVTSSAQSNLLTFVQRCVPSAQLGECTTSEVSLKLPFNTADSFANLFEQLESNREELGIESYGIEDCSLEEIFLSVTEADRDETVDKDASTVVKLQSSRSSFRKERQLEETVAKTPFDDDNDLLDPKQSQDGSSRCATPSAVPLDMQSHGRRRGSLSQPPVLCYTDHPLRHQIKALWIKRFTVIRRSKMGFVAEFLLPMFFILLSLGLQQIMPTDGDNPEMQLAPWYMLGTRDTNALRTKKLYSFVETLEPAAGNLQDAENLKDHFYNTDSLGTRCISTSAEHGNDKFSCLAPSNPPSAWGSVPANLPLDTSNCRCSYEKYPESAKCVDWPTPASKNLLSADIFENYTLYNVTNYVQSTVTKYFKIRFGGFTLFVNDTDPMLNYVSTSELSVMQSNMGIKIGNSKVYNFSTAFSDALNALQSTTNVSELLRAQVWYDNRGYVSGPAYLNILNNAMLRSRLPTNASKNLYGVSGWTHPITLRSKYVENMLMSQTITSAITVVSIIFALSFIPASFVLFLITERRTNAKHLQFVSGINPALYWLINHLWNMMNYLVPLTILILIFVAFNSEAFVSKDTIGPFIIIMLLFGFANAPVMYPFSWVLSVPSKAFTLLSCLNLGVGFVTTMSVAIVEMIARENEDTQMENTANALKYVFLVFPHFCLGQGLMELNYYYQFSVKLKELADSIGVSVQTLASMNGNDSVSDNPWDPTMRYIICLAVHSVVYFGLVLLIEYNFFCGKGCCSGLIYRSCHRDKYSKLTERREVEEDDVKTERDRVLGNPGGASDGTTGSDCLQIRDLVKIFHTSTGPWAAVNGVTLGVSQRECFGFLGVNGAGKTTTFKMLTGDIDLTSGDATLNGYSILTDVLEAHKQMGYCPQFDALLPLLSGRETLQLFARIRGIAEDQIPELITYISRMVGIVPHLDKLTEEYSGGNKRKLSCGIAFIGGPPIVFLDEPTAGMDPGARRFLWRCIQRMVAAGSCVILTSHSMEDCQALCHKLTIMVNGQLKCLGSPQHLKTKYGQGFTVFLRLSRTEEPAEVVTSKEGHQNPRMTENSLAANGRDRLLTGDVLSLHERFMSELPEAQLKEEHGSLLQYQISQDVTLSRIFNVVNSLKSEGSVQDYSVNQTTLDQVFINFAKKQTEMTKEEKQGSKVLRSVKREIRKKSASVGSVRQPAESRTEFASLGRLR